MDLSTVITWVLTIIVVLCSLGFAIYRWFTAQYGYFKEQGIPGPDPQFPLGNLGEMIKIGIHKFDMDNRKKYGDVVGTFHGRKPVMVIYDSEMLKQITIKEFHHFPNRVAILQGDPIMDKMIQTIHGDHWKHVRTLLTPTFSSGRLRSICRIINVKATSMVRNLQRESAEGKTVEIRDRCGAFTMDTIAGTAFGIDLDSQVDLQNPFIRHSSKFFDVAKQKFRVFLILVLPTLLPYLTRIGIGRFDPEARKFFVDTLKQAIKNRQEDEDSDKARDFIQLMLNAHKEKVDITAMDAYEGSEEFVKENKHLLSEKRGLTEDEVLAQGMIVMVAGYETTASTLGFLFYNIALQQDIQERLFAEINKVMEGHKDPSYDLVAKMKYMDQCIEETMRIYPAASRTDRECVKDITINGMFFPKNMSIAIPIYSVNMDPEVYPDPTRFDPERFSVEEKANRSPINWLSFGAGPRMCLGMRLARLEMKICVVHMLKAYKILTCDETPKEIKFLPLQTKHVGGMYLKMENRLE